QDTERLRVAQLLERLDHLRGAEELRHAGEEEQRRGRRPGSSVPPSQASAKNASVRTSMLSRTGASGRAPGSSNALCAVKRARAGAESKHLRSSASSAAMREK